MGRAGIETLAVNKATVASRAASEHGTPTYVYFQSDMHSAVDAFLAIPAPDGLVVRYAMKANPNAAVLRTFDRKGTHFDASTFNEASRAINGPAKIDGRKIRLTSQQVQSPDRLEQLADWGVLYTAASLRQLDTYGQVHPGTRVGIRFNPGFGSGGTPRTTTGGESSSFGIYGYEDEIKVLLDRHNLELSTVHLHIGSGSDPAKQVKAIQKGLELVRTYPTVDTLNMGGGFKVGRMSYEEGTDIGEMGDVMGRALKAFKDETGRELLLEVEPGTALIANAGYIVTKVTDTVDTGQDGYTFVKVDGGMSTNARPPMYGAEHPLYVLPEDGDMQRGRMEQVVVGECCESGDNLTPQAGQPDLFAPRELLVARRGDLLLVGGAGAYTASMAPTHYNSNTNATEVLVREDGRIDLVRQREPLPELWRHERVPADL